MAKEIEAQRGYVPCSRSQTGKWWIWTQTQDSLDLTALYAMQSGEGFAGSPLCADWGSLYLPDCATRP